MGDTGSLTVLLRRVQGGEQDEAVRRLWEVAFRRLVGLARQHLGGRPRAAHGPEDVALAAFDSFVRRAAAGRFPRLDNRGDLWQVLFLLTARKADSLVRADRAGKRDAGREVSLAALAGGEPGPAGSEVDPAEAAAMADGLTHLLAVLGRPNLQQVAVWKLEGLTNREIAGRLGRAESTVERKLGVIRERLRAAGLAPGGDSTTAGKGG